MLRYITVSKVDKNSKYKENRQTVPTITSNNVLMKNTNVLTENKNVQTTFRKVFNENKNVLTTSRKVLTENKNVLTTSRKVLTENKNVLTTSRKVLTENKNVLTTSRKVLTENRNNIDNRHTVPVENKNVFTWIANRKCACNGCRNGNVCSEKENKGNNCSPPTYLLVDNKLHSPEFIHVAHSVWSEKFYTPYLDFKMSFQTPCCRNPSSCVLSHQNFETFKVPYGQMRIFHFLLEEQLWDKAFEFFMYVVSDSMYPDCESFFQILQFIYSTDNVKLRNIAGRIVRHVIDSHPPCAPNMRSFYFDVMTSAVSDSCNKKCEGIFSFILSELEHILSFIDQNSSDALYTSCASDKNGNTTFISCCKGDKEHVSHLCFLLKFMLEIVENDIVVHLAKDKYVTMESNSLENPLAVLLLWIPNFSLRDSIILQFKRFTKMYANSVHFNLIPEVSEILSRLLAIIAEVGRVLNTNASTFYPLFNNTTEELAKEMALSFTDVSPTVLTKALCGLSPNWLVMLVTNCLLTNMKKLDEMSPSLEIVIDYLKISDEPHDQEIMKQSCVPKKKTCVKVLNINKRNHLGETRLHIVCRLNKTVELSELLSYPNIDINVRDNYGWTPLHNAIKYGNIDCVTQLLNYRSSKQTVNLHAKSHNGITPFLDAILSDEIEICKLLIRYGGYILLRDKTADGKMAIDMAQSIKMHKFLKQTEELFANAGNLKFAKQSRYSHFEPTSIESSRNVLEIFTCAYVKVYRIEPLLHYFYKDNVSVSRDSYGIKKKNVSNVMIVKTKFDIKHLFTLNSYLMQKECAKQTPGLAFILNKVLFYK